MQPRQPQRPVAAWPAPRPPSQSQAPCPPQPMSRLQSQVFTKPVRTDGGHRTVLPCSDMSVPWVRAGLIEIGSLGFLFALHDEANEASPLSGFMDAQRTRCRAGCAQCFLHHCIGCIAPDFVLGRIQALVKTRLTCVAQQQQQQCMLHSLYEGPAPCLCCCDTASGTACNHLRQVQAFLQMRSPSASPWLLGILITSWAAHHTSGLALICGRSDWAQV